MRRYYPGITIFKLVGCLLVLFAHLMLNKYIGDASNQQLRFLFLPLGIIVPCFYVVAGFLAYQGWSNAREPRQYVRRNLWRILIFLYLPFCLLFIVEHNIPELVRGGMNLGNLLLQAKIVIAAVVMNGPSVQLWFIPPLLFSMLICYWFFEKRLLYIGVIMALIGFLWSLLISGSLRSLSFLHMEGYSPNNEIMTYTKLISYRYLGLGFTFFLTGMLVAKYEEKFYRARVWPLIIGALTISTLELLYLLFFNQWSTEYKITFSLIPNTILLFYGLIHMKGQVIQTYHRFINLFSMVTFVGHILLMRLNLFVLNWDATDLNGAQDLLFLVLTFVECLVSTIIIYNRNSILMRIHFLIHFRQKGGHKDRSV
ncbi:acyltransferase family protein [Bacillus sp. 3255]|uniref:acyltransferase family protein n=1 Tax=Bacillus sp. 3255 TaxID=2817904 RepID=UPI0028568C2B|nr:acyltransferase family protein [Bacillus sp. 3255]MDR6878651.1 hypothetical protein [Bacillus sp. 3255]